jgi:cystathionine beta-lyase
VHPHPSVHSAVPAPTGFSPIDLATLREQRRAKWSVPADVLGAAVAEMDFRPPTVISQALADAIAREDFGYPHSSALDAAADALVEWSERHYGWRLDRARIVTTGDLVGAMEVTLTHFTDTDAPVVVPTPAYPPFLTIPRSSGRELYESPMIRDEDGWHLDLTHIRRAFGAGARTLLLCNPHNPTGTVFSAEELRELAEIVDLFGGRVFSDEIHAPLVYPASSADQALVAHTPYATVSAAAARHAVTGVSATKGWNIGGIKCAHLIVAERDARAAHELSARLAHAATTPGLWATAAAYNEGDPWRREALSYLDGNRRLLQDLVSEHLGGVSYRIPDSTYLGWLDFRRTEWADRPARWIRECARVDTSEGRDFGAAGNGFIRMNFATSSEILESIVLAIAAALQT